MIVAATIITGLLAALVGFAIGYIAGRSRALAQASLLLDAVCADNQRLRDERARDPFARPEPRHRKDLN